MTDEELKQFREVLDAHGRGISVSGQHHLLDTIERLRAENRRLVEAKTRLELEKHTQQMAIGTLRIENNCLRDVIVDVAAGLKAKVLCRDMAVEKLRAAIEKE